ncbi:hypothetical protein OE88DRAFT_1072302 [Heliocybe sulcata]|uniref:Uncharacterized protein n=1 Tax=Heliocybe sulcata TaxID=5364 RepID=A0A5C3MMG4_9AGAM|nr:hypothetical protein OE88DRAFT_1072302 [Heliocybe sulcata]
MDMDVSGSDTHPATRPGQDSLQFSSHFYGAITGHDISPYYYPSTSLDLSGFRGEFDNIHTSRDFIDRRQSPVLSPTQNGFCTNPSCILPSPPPTTSDLKRTVPLPHIHSAPTPHHHIPPSHGTCSSMMQPGASSYHTPPSPPLTVSLGSQSLPDMADSLPPFGQPSRSRSSSILERQSTLDSPELRTPISPAWHFAPPSKSELSCIAQDPMEFESEPGYIYDLRSPPRQPVSLPQFEEFPEQEGPWEARRLRQPDFDSYPRWSPDGDSFEGDSEMEEDLLQPPESPRPGSMSMDLPEDDLLYAPHHATASHSGYGYGTGSSGHSDMETEPFPSSMQDSYSCHDYERAPRSPRNPLLNLRTCMESDESFSSLESTMPVEENEFSVPLTRSPMPPPLCIPPSDHETPSSSPLEQPLSSPSDSNVDMNDPYCPTPLAPFDSPSRRSFTELPDMDGGDGLGTSPSSPGSQENQQPQSASPRQTLLSLPGVETDEELLPPSQLFPPAEPEPDPEGGLLLLHPPCDELTAYRNDQADMMALIPLALREDYEVEDVVALRAALMALERRARAKELAAAAVVAQANKDLLAFPHDIRKTTNDTWVIATMSELRYDLKKEKEKQAVAKRVRKKEKERGREIGALIRLKVAERAGEAGMEVDELFVGAAGGHKGKHRDCCGHGGVFPSVPHLVAKMVFKRRESCRPLTNRRTHPFRSRRSTLSQCIAVADSDGGFGDR